MRRSAVLAPSSSISSSHAVLLSSKTWCLHMQTLLISLFVVSALFSQVPVEAVNNLEDIKNQGGDVHRAQNDSMGRWNRFPEVKNSGNSDKPRLGNEQMNITRNNLNSQAAVASHQEGFAHQSPLAQHQQTDDVDHHGMITVTPKVSKDVYLAQPYQKLAGQEREKPVDEISTKGEIENVEEKKLALKKKEKEEREKAFYEHIKRQEQQGQGGNGHHSILEAQKEQQREQKWLQDVHRKSQEVLAQKQRQQTAPEINQVPGAHERPQRVVLFSTEHAPLNQHPNQPQVNTGELTKNDISSSKRNQEKDNNFIQNNLRSDNHNSNNFNNKDDSIFRNSHFNNSFRQDLAARVPFGQSGDNHNISTQAINDREIRPRAEEGGSGVMNNKLNYGAVNKEVELHQSPSASTTRSPNGSLLQNNSSHNSGLDDHVVVNVRSVGGGNTVEQNSNTRANPSNVVGNSNPWAKIEFNNVQQPQPHQQQHQQPQIGGINLSWDWEDFSVMFNSYGAAEMKVRRSPHPTTGEPWPMPQYYSKKDDKIYKVSKELHFVPTGTICDILEEGLTRHQQRTLRGCVEDMYDNLQNAEGSPIDDPALRYERDEFLKAPVITRVEVKVRKPCEKYPSLESDESYDLVVKKKKTYIWANEVWGALRGLETFGHLVWRGTDGFLYIKETVISDYPRFPHRGLHIDTSRHFLFKEVILDILDSMEMNKLNVFHWHIVDDQSFPYESKVYPELSRKGAFHPTYVYSLEDIAEIIEFARLRGIRVMPEFDTPGHTYAWGLSRPELLTQCYSGSIPVKGYLGPIDPSKNSTYRFLQTLFKEIVEVFKDQYIHLGGDEVPLGCWQSNPEVSAFAQELAKKPRDPPQGPSNNGAGNANFGGWNMWSDDIRRVYEYYENRLISIVSELGQKRKKGVKYVMWQEVMNNNLQLPNDTIIQVWMGDMADVMRATSMGYQVIYSTCWYLDHIEYGTKWPKYYNCDPVDQSFGFHIDEKKVLGGEAAFWAEYFSNENLIPLMWPRASAVAERLWSSKEVKNLDKAAERLTEHRCRMIKRGISAGEINGPGYCLHSPPKRRLFNDTAGCKGGNCSRTHNFVQIEDFEVHLSRRGGSLADCGNVFSQGSSNVFVVLILALVAGVALYALSKSSSHFSRLRICKNRSILVIFVGLVLIYILCNTTIWMRAFEFSGSFHKTLQEEDSQSESRNNNNDDGANFHPISF